MAVLLDRSLVRISGRADVPGRPLLYSTTGYFLEHFGLKSTGELPNADELMRMELPKAKVTDAKVAEEKPAGKGRAKRLEGTEDENVAAEPVASLVEIVHEEKAERAASADDAASSEEEPVPTTARYALPEDDEEEAEDFEEVGELIEDGCVVEPGDDEDEEETPEAEDSEAEELDEEVDGEGEMEKKEPDDETP
jgi:hypothetical protein